MTPHLPIVGIGASAGGVEALEAFFRAVPGENGMAFVVVTHLPPDRDSLLAEILGRATQMPVVNARDDQPVEAQHVYVLPASAVLTIRGGRLRLRHAGTAGRERAPIDVFFTSLAEDQGEHAIGVVLSGGGSDDPARTADQRGKSIRPVDRRIVAVLAGVVPAHAVVGRRAAGDPHRERHFAGRDRMRRFVA